MPEAHLDDEQLSDVLDGLRADAHVLDCARCAARLEAMRSAAAMVATPPSALSPEVVEDLVSRAVSAASAPGTEPIPFDRAARRRQPRWIPGAAAMGAVAAVLVLLLAVPLVVGSTGGNERGSTAEVQMAQDGASAGAGGEAATGDATAGGTESRAAAPSSEAFATDSAASALATTSLGRIDSEDELVRALVANVPAEREAIEDSESPPTTTPTPPAQCEDAARAVGGSRLGGRTYTADVVWRSVDAEVMVFDLTEPVDGRSRQAYVMSRQGCRVLAEPRF